MASSNEDSEGNETHNHGHNVERADIESRENKSLFEPRQLVLSFVLNFALKVFLPSIELNSLDIL